MKIYTLTFVVMFLSIILSGQELIDSDKNFNQIYEKIAIQVAGKDPTLAIKKADSLYISAASKYQKFKSLMLKAHVYAQIGELHPSIETAKTAEILANETDFYSWQARISGFISTQYRISGLYSEAKKYLDKTLLTAAKIKSEPESAKIQSFVYQEKADIEKKEENYHQSVEYYRKSGKILEKFPKDNKTNYYLISTNDAYLADAFFLDNSYDSALVYYNKADKNLSLSGYEDPKLKSYILVGLGKLDVINKNEISAKGKIDQALKYAEESGALAVKESGNEVLTEYYLTKEDSTGNNFQTHAQRTIESVKQISNVKQKAADHALKEVHKEKENLFFQSAIYVCLVSLLLLTLIIVFIRYKNKKKKEFLLYQKAIDELRESKILMEEYLEEEMDYL